jgi:hypothetical protein
MALTHTTVAALPDWTDAEMLKVYRMGLMMNAAGQSRTIEGRQISFPPLTQMMAMIEWLETRVQIAADAGSGTGTIVLAELREP